MKKTLLVLFIFFSTLTGAQTQVYYATLDKTISANPLLKYHDKSIFDEAKVQKKVTIYPQLTYQTLQGIGGCFNEIGGVALMSLPENKRKDIILSLFDEQSGAGFTFCRTAVGASDFGVDAYSYSEVKDDYKMEHFSVAREERNVIPYIKMAFAVNPDLKLFASPWSPPAWMKKSGKMTGSGNDNRLIETPEISQSYALYLARYIQAYSRCGITVNRICPQNETDCNTNYPSNIFPPFQMEQFICDYLSPMFKKENVETEIWAGTYRVVDCFEALELFNSLRLRKTVQGVGVQYTATSYLADFRIRYPNIRMMHTECICYNGKNTVDQAFSRLGEIASYINAGSENFAYWNMILNESSKSGWDWAQNSLLNINRDTGEVTYNPDYAVMYLMSRFLRPGDVRIASAISNKEACIAVRSPDGTYKVIMQNSTEKEQVTSIQIANKQSLKVMAPAKALVAVVIQEKIEKNRK